MLGIMSDAEIAVKYEIHREIAAARRRELGIPRQRGSGTVAGGLIKRTHGQIWTPEEDSLLGVMTDIEVAVAIGTTHKRASERRRELGISGQKGRKRAKGKPTTESSPGI